jgi:alcohol dehydrogenase class IV
VISFGGGSAIDAGKAVAALLANPGDPLDYLEVIGRGQPLRSPSAPFIAVPTTAGTGAEVTRNAVLGSPEHGVKASLRSAGMLPTVAIVDPELTLGLPPHLTAQTGLDALTQLIEPFVCRKANPITDAFCRQGIPLVVRSLQQAFADGTDLRARTDMALASLLGGLALANAGLGAVHGFAAPIGGMFPAPHGAVCATILPHAMKANIEALRKRDPHGPGLARFQELAELITGDRDAAIEDGLAWVQTLCQDLRVPGLSQWGVRVSDGPELAMKAARANSMKANPIDLAEGELVEILERALG